MQSHTSSARVLERRTLEGDHRTLGALWKPGDSVLDVGCGTGAITAGAARRVGTSGLVVGIDQDSALLEVARATYALPTLRFESGDALSLGYKKRFDVVTASRVMQWIDDPGVAVREMVRATKPWGRIAVLEYNHSRNRWIPAPPHEFLTFYQAFLRWRSGNGWSKLMGNQLRRLFWDAGLVEIRVSDESEIVSRCQERFGAASEIWSLAMQSVGPSVVASGYISEKQLARAEVRYLEFVAESLVTQELSMKAASGRVPGAGAPASSDGPRV